MAKVGGGDRPTGHPDLVVVYLGMQVKTLPGLKTLASFGPKIQRAVQPRPDGLLFHQLFVFELLPLHGHPPVLAGLRRAGADGSAPSRTVPLVADLSAVADRPLARDLLPCVEAWRRSSWTWSARPGLLAFAPGNRGAGADVLGAPPPPAGGRGTGPTRALRTGVLWLKLDQACALHEHRAFIPDLAASAGPPTACTLFACAECLGGQGHAASGGSGARRQCPNRHPYI